MPLRPVIERPLEDKVGLNPSFEEVRRWIRDSQVKKIGIHGMGGVGKTTLLTMLNNDLVKISYGFDLVLWVVVSKEPNMGKVQETICERLKLSDELWKNKAEDKKLEEIFEVLRTKKFVIMLDDLWERLDLKKVGIPTSDDHMYKVVFTTRSNDVCGQMGADKMIEIRCLAREESFALFKKNVGMNTLNVHPSIPNLAKSIAEECKGLPLALVVLGRAMSSKCNPRDWDRALEKLRKNPSDITGMDEEVFQILKFSYDNLRGNMKLCFIYCCLYPEDDEIWIDYLLDLWIGEGYLDEFDDVHEARDRGREIVEELKAASLLEKGKLENCVKMHDVIRDMALWISRDCQGKTNKYMVLDRVELLEVQSSVSMTTADKISVWGGCGFSDKPNIHSSKNASTFIVRFTEVEMFPSGLVLLMRAIKILDLSLNIRLTTLPQGIGGLVELEFLNISSTSIKELPLELNNLIKMKFLLLDNMVKMTVIPRKLISSFSLLRLFRIYYSASQDNTGDNILSDGGSELLEELESLQPISDISILLYDAASVNKLQHSSKLQNCVSALSLCYLEDVSSVELSSSFVKGLRNLERLHISYCKKLTINCEHGANFNCLRNVEIRNCSSLVHLTWLAYAPALEILHVYGCPSMVEIVEDHVGVGPDSSIFSRLQQILLDNMPSLRSIYQDELPFDSLVGIYVRNCPSLRRLPFDSSSAKGTLKYIRGEREWWDQLQWDDQTHQPLFRPYFVED